MEEFLSEILKQFPILAIFLWYVTQQNKRCSISFWGFKSLSYRPPTIKSNGFQLPELFISFNHRVLWRH